MMFTKNERIFQKQRSMQPKNFDVELANSAERAEKRRRRRALTEKGKAIEELTPLRLNPAVFVAETQQFSPVRVFQQYGYYWPPYS